MRMSYRLEEEAIGKFAVGEKSLFGISGGRSLGKFTRLFPTIGDDGQGSACIRDLQCNSLRSEQNLQGCSAIASAFL